MSGCHGNQTADTWLLKGRKLLTPSPLSLSHSYLVHLWLQQPTVATGGRAEPTNVSSFVQSVISLSGSFIFRVVFFLTDTCELLVTCLEEVQPVIRHDVPPGTKDTDEAQIRGSSGSRVFIFTFLFVQFLFFVQDYSGVSHRAQNSGLRKTQF